MIKLDILKDKKIGVFGLGKSGLASVEALKFSEIEFIWYDDKHEKNEFKIYQEFFAPLEDPRWREVDMIISSPGIDYFKHPISQTNFSKKPEIICDIELLYRAKIDAKFLAITGTNGKSTTTSLVNHILQKSGLKSEKGGNIGLPALAMSEKTEYYILEISSYQLELIKNIKFCSAVILNITPDHLERHLNMANYSKVKESVFAYQNQNDAAILNLDNQRTKEIYDRIKNFGSRKVYGFSVKEEGENLVTVKNGHLIDNIFTNKKYYLESNKYLSGLHNQENIAASYILAKTLGLVSESIIEAVSCFSGLEHRQEYVKKFKNSHIINDSKATNADSTYHALNNYDNIYWILGGVAKSDGIDKLAEFAPKIIKAYLVGEAKFDFAKFMDHNQINHIICKNLEEAVNLSLKDAGENHNINNILLSPACASFDEWANFEQRGEYFKKYVDIVIDRQIEAENYQKNLIK